MQFTVAEISQILGGEIEGNGDLEVSSVAKIEEASTGDITFLANPKYEEYLYNTKASAIIVSKEFVPQHDLTATLIRVDDPYSALSVLLNKVNEILQEEKPQGIEEPCYIDPSAKIGKNVYIGAFSYIAANVVIEEGVSIYPQTYIGKDCFIDQNTTIYSGAKIYHKTQIGKNCIIHSGAIIGGDGFGFAPNSGSYNKVPQLGNVVIEDMVEIGSNTTIDRATMGSTRICMGVKLDNLIQIAHNVTIGENTVIAALTGIAGSAKIGKNCMIGGQVGIVGHINIADGTKIAAQSGLNRDTQENEVLFGSPAFDYKQGLKAAIVFQQLPQMKEQLNELMKKLNS